MMYFIFSAAPSMFFILLFGNENHFVNAGLLYIFIVEIAPHKDPFISSKSCWSASVSTLLFIKEVLFNCLDKLHNIYNAAICVECKKSLVTGNSFGLPAVPLLLAKKDGKPVHNTFASLFKILSI